jgi:hypothetical protein
MEDEGSNCKITRRGLITGFDRHDLRLAVTVAYLSHTCHTLQHSPTFGDETYRLIRTLVIRCIEDAAIVRMPIGATLADWGCYSTYKYHIFQVQDYTVFTCS